MKNFFTDHPHSIGETYIQHLRHACRFGFYMIIGGMACLIHAIFPFIFKKTASEVLLKMTHRFIERSPHLEDNMMQLFQLLETKKTKI